LFGLHSEISSLYRLFERTALQKSGRIAVEIGSGKITYGDLNTAARRLAATILDSGCSGPVVAVMAHKSLEAYTAVLGVLAAGKGYVPLHPLFPVERTTAILNLSGADVLVIAPESLAKLPQLLNRIERTISVIPIGFSCTDSVRAVCGQHRVVELGSAGVSADPEPSSVAYLLFTSGTTGVPKGVPISNYNALSYFSYVLDRYPVSDCDRFSQTFDMTFDLSVHDMFTCWAVGGCLCPLGQAALLMPGKFIRDHKITVWFSVPSVAMLMHGFRQLAPGGFPELRVSLFAGEALSAALAAAWQNAAPNSIVENLYGPTEATMTISHYRWCSGDETRQFVNGIVPIGQIFPAQRGRVGREDGSLVPNGTAGELWLSGSQLTVGYWNNLEQTAQAFVRLGEGQELWYKTGDLVSVDDDGGINFLGRIDSQVQVMGHRVELEEVEYAIRQAAGTEMAVAVPWPLEAGRADKIYAVCCGGTKDSTGLKQQCATSLPAYMIPESIFWIDEMPLNSNGKIDRRKVSTWIGEMLNVGRS